MTNAEIAAVFARIGKILQLRNENPFRIRAYERGSMAIASLPHDVGSIYREGGTKALQEIPGIGFDLAAKIEEMTNTGKLIYLAELEKKFPPGMLDIMDIPGVGPKKTAFLWKKYKVQSVADLEALVASG